MKQLKTYPVPLLAFFLFGFLLSTLINPLTNLDAKETVGLPLQELRAFADVFGRIKNDYVEPVDDRELLEYAIRGMLSGLDPHSAYLNEDEFKDLQVGTTGEFGGLGIEVGMEDGFIKIIAPIDDTPAQRAGLQAGDLIIRLDGKPIKGITLTEAVNQMRGKPGTTIELTILRENKRQPFEVTLERAVIKIKSVRQELLEPGFGYIRISHFQAHTIEDLLTSLQTLETENQGKLKGIVLDLRNNPGGILNSAVAVSDAFLDEGLIVYTEGRLKESILKFKASPDDVLNGAPIVVLIDGGSASASEIVAGALQDHKRAVIMGSQSFGKGSVQTIIPVNDKTAIKLTTARYFTPSGRSIQAEGITPDIELDKVKVELAQTHVKELKEADLTGHLDEDKKQSDVVDSQQEQAPKKSLAARDYQLHEAINLLKGLYILRQKQHSY